MEQILKFENQVTRETLVKSILSKATSLKE